jgi:hypothetical protein
MSNSSPEWAPKRTFAHSSELWVYAVDRAGHNAGQGFDDVTLASLISTLGTEGRLARKRYPDSPQVNDIRPSCAIARSAGNQWCLQPELQSGIRYSTTMRKKRVARPCRRALFRERNFLPRVRGPVLRDACRLLDFANRIVSSWSNWP